jgi:rhamnulokinase
LETHHFLAFDLGAESGRTILGTLEPSRLLTRELTRFPNGPVPLLGHLHWNALYLYEEIKRGMGVCLAEAGVHPESLGVDTWGVDFGLLGRDGGLLGLPYAYRDSRTEGAMEEFFERVPRRQIYEWTGVQFLSFNTLFQLYAMVRDRSPLLECAAALLFLPDLFNYFLTREKTSEFTIASTSQFLDPRRSTWCEPLLGSLGIPLRILPEVLSPGTVIASLTPEVAQETGLNETQVVATAGHDTAAAIAAAPAEGKDWAYISSGTWSLMGIETRHPIINRQALEANFTNEGGVGGTIRFLKNIAGLWLIQQCRKEWARGAPLSYDEITQMAGEASPFRSLIDPDWPEFLNPPSMPEAIRLFCLRTRQNPPLTPPQIVRCILESLALKYRFTLDQLRRIVGTEISRIHVIGGGSRNELLCRFTAAATGLPVIAGPAEATAGGNIMVQALALGYVRSLADIRAIIRNSIELKTYEPSGSGDWERAYERFGSVLEEVGR